MKRFEKGSPQEAKYYKYQLEYRKAHYKHFNLLFDPRHELDAKILEALANLPNKTKTALVKNAIAKEMNIL